jgi:hypothetical protein
VRVVVSPRLWAACFALTSGIYLLHADGDGIADGRWPLLAPWLHSSALPVFAVLSVVFALLWSAVRGWLSDYEQYAEATYAAACRLGSGRASVARPRPRMLPAPPRTLFGLAFESRPPPALV